MKLPYPGYSWSITQHIGPVAQREVMYQLLSAAYDFRTEAEYQSLISQQLVEMQLLTENIRGGRPQPWRDYQQVLTEMGLIVSTRRLRGEQRRIVITPLGLMWLDGHIGFSELITTQCLRYQYPNGYKLDISTSVRRALSDRGMSFDGTRTELDTLYKVKIKPAVLILRILLELGTRPGNQEHLNVFETTNFIMPTSTNKDWPLALQDLDKFRSNTKHEIEVNGRSTRHIQEWFRLLDLTDIFEVGRVNRSNAIRLTQQAKSNTQLLRNICAFHEDPDTFWSPRSTEPEALVLSWFDYYGNPNTLFQWFLPEEMRTEDYVTQNYPIGSEHIEERPELTQEWIATISSRPITEDIAADLEDDKRLTQKTIERIEAGMRRRRQTTRLHDEIVRELATKYQLYGYKVSEDPQSVDLLVNRENDEAILEVKTVTARNLRRHVRLGAAQLQEYRYRQQLIRGDRSQGILVLSSEGKFPEWFINFLDEDVNLSLVSRASQGEFSVHTRRRSPALAVLDS